MSKSTVSKRVKAQPRRTVEVARLFPSQGEWTETDYLALPETNSIVELSEGELIMPPPPSVDHQDISAQLFSALRSFVRERDLGTVLYAPTGVRLWPGKIREPDVLFVAHEHADRIKQDMIYGPPDLVVEILSPGTEETDRWGKCKEYEQAGVSEYWIVDPETSTVTVYALTEGAYKLQSVFSSREVVRSALLEGFEIAVDEIFKTEWRSHETRMDRPGRLGGA